MIKFLILLTLTACTTTPPRPPAEKLDPLLKWDAEDGKKIHSIIFEIKADAETIQARRDGIRASGLKVMAGELKPGGIISGEATPKALRMLSQLACIPYISKSATYELIE